MRNTSGVPGGTNAVLVDNHFKILGVAIGEAESVKILGFGGLKKDALVFDAKNDLYQKAGLKPGQALTNMTVDFKQEFYLVTSKTKVMVTGEIVDFNPDNHKSLQNNYRLKDRNGYTVGEQIYAKTNEGYVKGKIERLDLSTL